MIGSGDETNMELRRKAWVLTESRISVGMPPAAGFLLTLIGSAFVAWVALFVARDVPIGPLVLMFLAFAIANIATGVCLLRYYRGGHFQLSVRADALEFGSAVVADYCFTGERKVAWFKASLVQHTLTQTGKRYDFLDKVWRPRFREELMQSTRDQTGRGAFTLNVPTCAVHDDYPLYFGIAIRYGFVGESKSRYEFFELPIVAR